MHAIRLAVAATVTLTAAQAASALQISQAWRFEGGATVGPPALYRATERGPVQGVVLAIADGRLVRLDGKGRPVWTHPIACLSHTTPAVADADGDGQCEIIAADFDGTLHCLSGDGTVKWTHRLRGGVFQQGGPGICDLEGDHSKEIIVGDRTGKTWCLNGRGRVRWTLDLGRRWVSTPAFADLDGDAIREIVIGEVDDHLYCLDASGQWLWELWSDEEVFGNSGCTFADLTGDGLPEVLVGGGLNHFFALDGRTGKYVREINTQQHINCAMAAADLDQDAQMDVVFGTRQGTLWRIGANGAVVWQKQYAGPILTSLCIADLAMGPEHEIVVPVAHSHLSIADWQGNEIASYPIRCGGESCPAVADVDGDGHLEVLIGDAGDASLVCLRTDAPARPDAVPWESMRGDAACTGNPSGVRAVREARAPITVTPSPDLALHTAPTWLAGANECVYRVQNAARKRLLLSFSCRKPGSLVERQFRYTTQAADRLACAISVDTAGTCQVEAQLLDVDQRAQIAAHRLAHNVDLFARDQEHAGQLLSTLNHLAAALQGARADILQHLRQSALQASGLLRDLATAKRQRLSAQHTAKFISELAAARAEIARTLALAEVIRARREARLNHGFVAWPGFPWHVFDGKSALPPSSPQPEIEMEAYIGEREWTVVNITSFAARMMRFRVEIERPKSPTAGAAPPRDLLQVFEAVDAPTLESLLVADALVPLGESSMVAVAPWESRQLWLRLWPRNVEPGEHMLTLRLTSVEPVPESQEISLRIRVWPIQIPSPGRLRFANWVVSQGEDEAFRDALAMQVIDHGVNVFPCGSPNAEFGADGRLAIPIDYTHHDAFVRRFAGHGKFLFSSPQRHITVEGAEMFSEKWVAAYRTYLSEWRKHLSDLGVSWEDCYLYPVDEASIAGSAALKELTETARISKQIDPSIRIFANPSMGATVEGLTELGQYVDAWCPSQELMDREGKPLLDFFKRTAQEVWFYDARGNSRTLSGLAFFRRQAWQAWHHGLNGMGFYACMATPAYAWVGPDGSSGYFDVMYPGTVPITSKRYEAAADGREDFEAMCILRDAAQQARAAGLHAEAVREADQLLTTRAEQLWQAIDAMNDRAEMMTDGSEAVEVARMLRDFRRRAAELTIALKAQ